MSRRVIWAAGVRPGGVRPSGVRAGSAAVVVAVGLLLALACDSAVQGNAAGRPNVVFVVLDTLRADHLEFYGYRDSTAPFLNRVAEQSAVFTRAFSSSSWTAPSTASLFTGLYPTRHGVTMGFKANLHREVERTGETTIQVGKLPASVTTLPEFMKRLGYRSYGVATNLNIGSAIGFDRGFDRFVSLSGEPAETVLKTLRSWKSEIEAEPPYFLYLHLNDVHKPYTQRAPWFEESGDSRADTVSAYDSEIHYVDGVLEKMLELFDFAPGGDRGGILVIASDHGEEFWDHGGDGHRFSLHYEVNRIALMLSGPGIRPGVRSENVSGVDVLPTLLDLIGAPPPDLVDGRSLSPLLLSGSGEDALRAELGSRPLLAHRAHRHSPDKELWAVVVGPWRLIVTPDGSQLYDLRSDIQEIRDLSGIETQQVAVLQAELDRFRAATPVERVETKVLLDSEDLRALRALGYVEDEDDSR